MWWFLLLLSCVLSVISEDELIFTHILFRHGLRAPLKVIPSDPIAYMWIGKEGELTNGGKQQLFELGKYFRKRYFHLTDNGTYSVKKVYVESSDVDRAIESAAANLAGFFPPEGAQVWNQNLLWQPIPIHTVPQEMDYYLNMGRDCPQLNQKISSYFESQKFRDWLNKIRPSFEKVEKNAGRPIRSLMDLNEVIDAIFVEKQSNMRLEPWMERLMEAVFRELNKKSPALHSLMEEIAHFTVGHLVKQMLDRFADKKNSTLSPDRTIWIYSGHDKTINNFMEFLGLNYVYPPFAAHVLFELYKSADNFYVQLFYETTIAADGKLLQPLNIPKCGIKCPLDQFYSIYKDKLPTTDFDTMCKLINN